MITSPLSPYKIIKHFLSNYLSYVPFSKIHLSRRAILKFQYCFESYLYGQWRPREHCFIALLLQIVSLHQMRPTQMLIHYNFSAEWAIQSFMSALCILFTDGTYETHLAYNVFSEWKEGAGGGLCGESNKNSNISPQNSYLRSKRKLNTDRGTQGES